MDESLIESSLREHRTALDLSQAELAARVGVSRQAIVAIEAGRQIPSTQLSLLLARELRVSVEDLFRLSRSAPLPLGEWQGGTLPARAMVGFIDGRWVAHSTSKGSCASDALIVARPSDQRPWIEPFVEPSRLEKKIVVCGCAPLLGLLGESLGRDDGATESSWIYCSSARSLSLLKEGQVHIAGLHLVDVDTEGGHEAIIREHFDEPMTVVHLTRWRQGFFVLPQNPKEIRSPEDLFRNDVRVGFRESGAAAQLLIERQLSRVASCSTEWPRGPVAESHGELASWVQRGFVDVGVGIEPAALGQNLDFVPLAEERFDLALPTHRLQQSHVARFLAQLEARSFRSEAALLPGYDLGAAGHAYSVVM